MIVIAAAMLLAGAGPSDALMVNFSNCLKTAHSRAKSQNVPVDNFDAFLRSACATTEQPYKASVLQLDLHHGMSKKDAAADAASMVNDYYSERLDDYKSEMEASGAAPKPKAPAPTPASEPTTPK
jgi:hypothetical protein